MLAGNAVLLREAGVDFVPEKDDATVVYIAAGNLYAGVIKLEDVPRPGAKETLAALKKAGLVDAARGAAGGYTLSRPPQDIYVGEVLRALEGSTAILDCVGIDDSAECTNACYCSARPLWIKLQQKIDEVLNTTTIKEMADDYAARVGKE